jgi:soluble lytic murein transglycosylase-like protein
MPRSLPREVRLVRGVDRIVATCLALLVIASGSLPAGATNDRGPSAPTPDSTAVLAASAESGSVGERLKDTRRQLDEAKAEVSAAEQKIIEVTAQLEEIEALLSARTAELTRLVADLAVAQTAYEEARSRTSEATLRVREAAAELQSLADEESSNRRRLDDRAAATYMRGGGAHAGAMVTALLGVTNLHDFAVGMRAIDVTVAGDKQLVERSRTLVDEVADRRARLSELRGIRSDEEVSAARALDRVTTLVNRQRTIVAEIAADRDERESILRSIEEDQEQQAALVRQLEAVIARLSAEMRRSASVRWQDIPIDGPMPDWAVHLSPAGQHWAPAIHDAAVQAGVDPRLFAALVWSESNFHPGAVSRSGAIGLTQLMPGTARSLGVDPHHPLQNLAGGARYLAIQIATFGSMELGLAAYNAGPGAVRRYEGIPPFAETQVYVLVVLRRYAELAGV